MKIIDKTPFQDEAGQISFMNRIQGTLKYGLSWYATLEAQKKVIAILNKVLEKGYTLVRNQQLGSSEIIVPLTLIGTAGIFVIEATPLKGFYRARGDEWGTDSNGTIQPASINILKRTEQLAKVLQKYFEKQNAKLTAPIEPVLMASDPGLHVESVRPVARVVQSDAIERFAESLLTARPIYNAQMVNELVDRLIEPRPASKPQPAPEPPAGEDPFAVQDDRPFDGTESSRLQTILNAPKSDALIDTGQDEIGFAFEEADQSTEPTVMVKHPPEHAEHTAPKPERAKLVLGMTLTQLLILGGMLLCWLVVMAIGIYLIL